MVWDDLNTKQRAAYIRLGVASGYRTIDDIKDNLDTIKNLYGDGGDKHSSSNYESLPAIIKRLGLEDKIRITSGYRKPGLAGNAGSRSNHTKKNSHGDSYAYDILPVNGNYADLENTMRNSPELMSYLINNGYRLLKETTPDVMKKTGATGPHWHLSYNPNSHEGTSITTIRTGDNGLKMVFTNSTPLLLYIAPAQQVIQEEPDTPIQVEDITLDNDDLNSNTKVNMLDEVTVYAPKKVDYEDIGIPELSPILVLEPVELVGIPLTSVILTVDNITKDYAGLNLKNLEDVILNSINDLNVLNSVFKYALADELNNLKNLVLELLFLRNMAALGGIINNDNPIQNYSQYKGGIPTVRYSNGGNLYGDGSWLDTMDELFPNTEPWLAGVNLATGAATIAAPESGVAPAAYLLSNYASGVVDAYQLARSGYKALTDDNVEHFWLSPHATDVLINAGELGLDIVGASVVNALNKAKKAGVAAKEVYTGAERKAMSTTRRVGTGAGRSMARRAAKAKASYNAARNAAEKASEEALAKKGVRPILGEYYQKKLTEEMAKRGYGVSLVDALKSAEKTARLNFALKYAVTSPSDAYDIYKGVKKENGGNTSSRTTNTNKFDDGGGFWNTIRGWFGFGDDNSESTTRNVSTDRKRNNTSPTARRSQADENYYYSKLPKLKSPYDISYIPSRQVRIKGKDTSFNVLDSLAKYAGEANRHPVSKKSKPLGEKDAIGLAMQETSFGATPNIDFGKAKDKDAVRALANMNIIKNFESIPAKSLVNDYRPVLKGVAPLLDSFLYYALGLYNTGDKSHTSDVLAAGASAFTDPDVVNWWNKEGKYWFNGTYKNAGDDKGKQYKKKEVGGPIILAANNIYKGHVGLSHI